MCDLTGLTDRELTQLRDKARKDNTPESFELRFRIIKERLVRFQLGSTDVSDEECDADAL